jgi:hypothetical protein
MRSPKASRATLADMTRSSSTPEPSSEAAVNSAAKTDPVSFSDEVLEIGWLVGTRAFVRLDDLPLIRIMTPRRHGQHAVDTWLATVAEPRHINRDAGRKTR